MESVKEHWKERIAMWAVYLFPVGEDILSMVIMLKKNKYHDCGKT